MARKDEFLEAQEDGSDAVGRFYSKMARMILHQWGPDLPIDQDGPIVAPALDSVCANAGAYSDSETEEKHKLLRKKLGQWFRHTFRDRAKSTTSTHQDIINDVLNAMHDVAVERPKKVSALATYSRRFYNSKLKKSFDAEWNKIKSSTPASARISMCHAYITDAFNNESPELRAEIEKESEDDYNKALKRYRESEAWQPHTAEEYAQAMENSPQILLPIVDAIAQRFGVYVAIMLSGPMSDGKIGLRSVHSTTVGGKTTKIWPEVDVEGFSAAEASVTTYAKKFFSKEECAARKVGLNDDELFQINKDLKDLADLEEDETETTPANAPTLANTIHCLTTNRSRIAGDGSRATNRSRIAGDGSRPPIDPVLLEMEAGPPIDPVLLEMEAGKAGDTVEGNGKDGSGTAVQQELCQRSAESQVNKDAPDTTTSSPNMSSPPEVSEPAQSTSPLAVQVPVTIEVPAEVSATIRGASPLAVQVPALIDPSPMPAEQVPALVAPHPIPASPTRNESITGAHALTPPSNDEMLYQALDLEMIPAENYVIRDGLAYLQGKEWGIGWKNCLNAWYEFEKSRGFLRDGGRLTPMSRPEIYSTWLKAHRPCVDQKVDTAFASEFLGWWNQLKSLTEPDEDSDADFSTIDKSGANGLFLVMMGLAWWGEKLDEFDRRYDGKGSWAYTVRDVMGMFAHLMSLQTGTAKASKPPSKR
ncbi:hypothetical protein H0H92_015318 [Tricholoma furcatifolium]|nr:hypothetical protein H0H92_015318 [Tricholoma furcatifolium]